MEGWSIEMEVTFLLSVTFDKITTEENPLKHRDVIIAMLILLFTQHLMIRSKASLQRYDY